MALSPDVTRGVLNVPGGDYSLMLTRSSRLQLAQDPAQQSPIRRSAIRSCCSRSSQSYWDWSDPITFAPHSIGDAAPRPRRQAAGAAPHPHAGGAQRRAGAEPGDARGGAHAGPAAAGSRPSSRSTALPPRSRRRSTRPTRSGTCTATTVPTATRRRRWTTACTRAMRKLPALIAQLQQFFRPDGQITQTCTGPCVFTPVP